MEPRVEHKSDNLEQYLAAISANLTEKTEILRYIIENEGGRYLEIGAGRDPFATLVEYTPPHSNTELVAIDADPAVLEHILIQHPSLPETAQEKGISIDFIPMDATNMRSFEDASFDGINASSLVHEIFSYAEGFTGVRNFIHESNRILKPDGVLVYRDPELQQPTAQAEMEIKDTHLKAFSLFYLLNAALDLKKLTENNELDFTRLGLLYDGADVTITATQHGQDEPTVFTIDDLVHIQLEKIDFNKPMSIKSENGILQEIARHFLTFHQSSPYGNILLEPDETGGSSVDYISSGTKERFDAFAAQNNIEVSDEDTLSPDNHDKLQAAIATTFNFLTQGTNIKLKDGEAEWLATYAQQLGIDPAFIEKNNDGTYTANSMLLSIAFDPAVQAGILDKDSFINATALNFFTYLKQEAQEFYYYLTPDEVVAVFAAASIEDSNGHMLAPNPNISSGNKSIERPRYDKFLSAVMSIESLDPNVPNEAISPREAKRIIHFAKLPLDQAVETLQKLVESSPDDYPATAKFLSGLTTPTSDGMIEQTK